MAIVTYRIVPELIPTIALRAARTMASNVGGVAPWLTILLGWEIGVGSLMMFAIEEMDKKEREKGREKV